MAFKISPQVFLAFEAQESAAEAARFERWWFSHADRLGRISAGSGAALIDTGRKVASEYGIVDNAEDRLFLAAAAARLIQRPSAAQALLLGDVFYLDLPLDGRFEKLLALVASSAAAR